MGSHTVDGDSLTFHRKKSGKPCHVLWKGTEIEYIVRDSQSGLFLVTTTGKPYTESTFRKDMRKWCNEARLPEHCTSHGLRAASASWWASQPGITAFDLMAIFGFNLNTAEIYIRGRKRKETAERAGRRVRNISLEQEEMESR